MEGKFSMLRVEGLPVELQTIAFMWRDLGRVVQGRLDDGGEIIIAWIEPSVREGAAPWVGWVEVTFPDEKKKGKRW